MPAKLRHGTVKPRGESCTPLSRRYDGRFGRLFRKLPPAPGYSDDELRALAETMREPAIDQGGGWAAGQQPSPFENPTIPAAYTYLGQFIDHDITFDPASSLDRQNDPNALENFRTPRFDLDSLYGAGQEADPFLYARDDAAGRLLIGSSQSADGITTVADVPRNSQGIALTGDPRNDENLIVSQLHLLFAQLHNKFVDQVLGEGVEAGRAFEEAQRRTRWTYQWVVVNDYLRRLIGDELDALYRPPGAEGPEAKFNLRLYNAKNRAYMPVEFSAAAFRLGHSQVRPNYVMRNGMQSVPIFAPGDPDPLGDLRGSRALPPELAAEWEVLVEIGGSQPQFSHLLDTKIAPGLFDLPGVGSLPLRNLQRGRALSLPSGQDVAKAIGQAPLSGADLGGVLDPTPLWFYVLAESQQQFGGQRLGSVGARIVGEVLLGLLQADPGSWVNQDPAWVPTIGSGPGLTLGELIAFARE